MGLVQSLLQKEAAPNYSVSSSPYGYTCMDKISDEGFRQYWEELEQRANLSLRLQDLIKNIDITHPDAPYAERFISLTGQIRKQCGIKIPNGVYPVVSANFCWVENKMRIQDHSLMKLWDEIEPQIPNGRKAAFLLNNPIEVKAQKVRAWFQDTQFDEDRRNVNAQGLDVSQLDELPFEIFTLPFFSEFAKDFISEPDCNS